MRTASATNIRQEFGRYLGIVEGEGGRIIVTRNGKPTAVLISLEDFQLIRQIEDRVDRKAADEAVREADAEGWLTWEEATRTIGP